MADRRFSRSARFIAAITVLAIAVMCLALTSCRSNPTPTPNYIPFSAAVPNGCLPPVSVGKPAK